MKRWSLITILIFCTPIKAEVQHWGAPLSKMKPISLAKAIKNHQNQNIQVEAKVNKVCSQKGCWMSLENKSGEIRVTFKDYKFFVPLALIGKRDLVEGTISSHTMSIREAKHYAKDAGIKDTSHIKSPVTEYRMLAKGVRLAPTKI